MLTLFIVGDALGAGIYALVGTVAGATGSALWTGFAAAGVLPLFTATAYAEAGLLAFGVVLWLIARALTGPAEPIDPAMLVD